MRILFLTCGRHGKKIAKHLEDVRLLERPSLFKAVEAVWGDYDILHTDSPLLHGWLFPTARMRGKKITMQVRGAEDFINAKARHPLHKRIAMSFNKKLALSYCDHVFFISRHCQEQLQYKGTQSVVHNGCDDLVEHVGGGGVVTVTNLDFEGKVDGVRVLVEAMRGVVKLKVFGKGRFLAELRSEGGAEYSYSDDIYSELAKADLFVYCSFADSWGQVLCEAQSAGLPIVCGGVDSLSEAAPYATVVQPTPEAFRKEIKRYLADERLREIMGERNKFHAFTHGWEWVAEQYAKVWK